MELIIASIIAFASTNIDDIFVLMLFFGNKTYRTKDIVIGQYLGVGTLILISLIGSFAGLLIDKKYIGLLGLLPIFLGIRALLQYLRQKNVEELPETSVGKNSVFTVAAVTFANGGDNIGIYIPLFATLSLIGRAIMISIFLLMIALWCLAGRYLSSHPAIAKVISKYGHILTPVVLVLLGLYILYESGSFSLLAF